MNEKEMKNSPVYKILDFIKGKKSVDTFTLNTLISEEAPEIFELFVKDDAPYTQLCVWPACIVLGPGILPSSEKGKEKIAEFETFMSEKFDGCRIKYAEETNTLPDFDKEGKLVPGTGGRNDTFFYIHTEDISNFAVPRLAYGIRWWEDVLSNGGGVLYVEEFLKKYPKTW